MGGGGMSPVQALKRIKEEYKARHFWKTPNDWLFNVDSTERSLRGGGGGA